MKNGYKYSWTEIDLLKQNWKKIAQEYNGTYKTFGTNTASKESSVLQRFELRIPFSDGEITFDTDEFKPLKIGFVFKNKLKTKFLIYPEDFVDKIGKLLGFKEFEIGDLEFDKNFFIKGDSFELINKILTSELKEYLINNYVVNLKLENESDSTKLELNIVVNELKYNNMKKLIELFQNCVMTIINYKAE